MNNTVLKILIVEDSKALANWYKQILESNGHKVTVTYDGKTELEIYEKELKNGLVSKTPFDLIISDNSMKEMNGVDAGKIIHDFFPEQKFFFITGEKNRVLDVFDVDGKNIDVEEKPISLALFNKKVKLLVQH
ncbi:response regulator [Candidatus Nitrosarchaeum limnium]|uniref:Response regulator receiver domain protein n=1 Tax=Candidatus Nitrosarchaeum limnium BG20 TaxID=859192 RepID=S2E5S1_9ARCH|nr:response regulator [Candidatus Nitrosarchaeum limnium]EPA06053.1 response regulator receiver domain protein [Candidatus Nitrosarchaeum limnium BG20]